MAEPNDNAEELLKRYAAKRREGAPTELHPATRRLLQGEVARVYGGARASLPWWRKLIAPRFAWGLAAVAILGFSVLTLRQPPAPAPELVQLKEGRGDARPELSLGLEVALERAADKDEAARDESLAAPNASVAESPSERLLADSALGRANQLAPPPAASGPAGGGFGGVNGPAAPMRPEAATGRAVRLADAEAPQSKERRVEQEALLRSQPAAPKAVEEKLSIAPEQRGRDVRAVTATAASSPAPSTVSQALFFSNTSTAQGQSPPQNAARGAAADRTDSSQVLSRFTVLQLGDQLQVTDADGSLYKGPVATQALANAYNFRVSGTNRTLRQPVLFTGQVMQVQIPALAQQQIPAQPQGQNNFRYAAPLQNNFYDNNQLRLQGQATIGNTQVPVDAQNYAPAQR